MPFNFCERRLVEARGRTAGLGVESWLADWGAHHFTSITLRFCLFV